MMGPRDTFLPSAPILSHPIAQPKPEPATSVERAKHSVQGTFLMVLSSHAAPPTHTQGKPLSEGKEGPEGAAGGGAGWGENGHMVPSVQQHWCLPGILEINDILLSPAIH